jgi:FkbM family methyltransferase
MDDRGTMRNGCSSDLLDAFRVLGGQGLGVIDVGSRGGIHPMFKEIAPILNVVGFEPDDEEWQRLQAEAQRPSGFRSLTYVPCALGRTDAQQQLHLGRLRGTSSFYEPNRVFLERFPEASRYDVVGTQSVPVRSLDSLVADPAVQMPRHLDFIKIDTQGSELDILRGATQALRNDVAAVEVEVEFARLYTHQPVFRDVDAFLDDCGFTLFKLRRYEWVRHQLAGQPHLSAGQVVFADALYLKDPLACARPWTPQAHQLEALVLLATLYDLHDFALEIVGDSRFTEALDAPSIRAAIVQRSQRLNRRWSPPHIMLDFLRLLRTPASWFSPFKRYERCWARGDYNFYSRI